MIYYWDTSAIVKVYHREEGSDRAMQMFSEVLSGDKRGAVAYVGLMDGLGIHEAQKGIERKLRGDCGKDSSGYEG